MVADSPRLIKKKKEKTIDVSEFAQMFGAEIEE